MDKFSVYIIAPSSVTRCFVSDKEVKYLLKNEESTILRTISNQIACLIDDQVFWRDVEDVPAGKIVNE